ncbi:class I SAM-dependent methyltransferase [Nesterenkonia sp. NBAIMH1]|uniref:class I SAM-dependent methyltransferase n=1 Tax=Nesterenkonia sp. NBAIMH1 TaxID=2600320 RepID=UPI0011B4B11F|nr:class I SAM-dependent methyltransferase [Nesterenkonia sp. NBAIMH1]
MERDSEEPEDSAGLVARPVAADWLTLRREADHRARERTAPIVDRISEWLTSQQNGDEPALVIDLGSGTGSNQAWLAPRLAAPHEWVLVDHDASLLNVSTELPDEHAVPTTRVVGTVDRLPELIGSRAPVLVTCAALLDLLSEQEAALIAETIASKGAAALLSLTVTGEVSLAPQDPFDAAITSAFDAHQRREDLLGPDGAEAFARMLRAAGAQVEMIATDWDLDSANTKFVERYLSDRAQAAVEQDPSMREDAAEWLRRRSGQLRAGDLTVRVGHLDIACVPGSAPTA